VADETVAVSVCDQPAAGNIKKTTPFPTTETAACHVVVHLALLEIKPIRFCNEEEPQRKIFVAVPFMLRLF
jgi:hypothetical protein